MAYEIFTRKVMRTTAPSVTFTKTGRLALNAAAAKLVMDQGTDLVLLLWDPLAKSVAVRPIHKKDDPRAYKVRVSGRPGKGKTSGFHAATFFDFIGFDFKARGTQAFPAQWDADQGLLEFSVEDSLVEAQQPLLAVGRSGPKRR